MGSVAAVVCTYRRPGMLRDCVAALGAQTYPIDEIIVVDNAATEAGAASQADLELPLTILEMAGNTGPAGGFAAGMRYGYEAGHQWIWLFNDDAAPLPVALERCMGATVCLQGRPGVVAANARADGTGEPTPALWFNMNGALVHRDVISEIGLPRADLFMCFEEHDFCMRMRKAGLPIFDLPEFLVQNHCSGSTGTAPPWRGYYQTRNELLTAVAMRSTAGALTWGLRQAKFIVATLLYLDRKRERVRMRMLGAWHGARGISGRTIVPDVTGGS